jgi:hypothetical protein
MSRSSMRAKREAERRFPVRIRVAVPPDGFGRQLAVMHAWLDETCGPEGWHTAAAGLSGVVNDAVAFYFADAAFAHAFVNRFCCGFRVEPVEGGFTMRGDRLPTRRAAAPHNTP